MTMSEMHEGEHEGHHGDGACYSSGRRSFLASAFFAVPVVGALGAMAMARPNRTGAERGSGKGGVKVVVAEGADAVDEFVLEEVGKAQGVLLSVPMVDGHRMRVETIPAFLVQTGTEAKDLRALSGICPHAGCAVEFSSSKRMFTCPCHAATFDSSGKRLDGPSPRDLDPLDVSVTADRIEVTFKRYRLNTSDRKEA